MVMKEPPWLSHQYLSLATHTDFYSWVSAECFISINYISINLNMHHINMTPLKVMGEFLSADVA